MVIWPDDNQEITKVITADPEQGMNVLIRYDGGLYNSCCDISLKAWWR